MIKQLISSLDEHEAEKIHRGIELLEQNSRSLQDSIMRIRMVPISLVFDKIPRLIFDLTTKLGKEVDLVIQGEDTELDKTIVEKLDQPLTHLVRNCLDHGLEDPQTRQACGKSPGGTINIRAYHSSGKIIIEINDDGAGINPKFIQQKAVEKGLIPENTNLEEHEIYDLLFIPGFSTATTVSSVSGRGVGMDVVKNNIQDLGGEIHIISEVGKGSSFIIQLPLTLAILDGQLVKVGSEVYIIPIEIIVSCITIEHSKMKTITNTKELYFFRGEYIPIIRLNKIFNVSDAADNIEDSLLVIIEDRNKYMAIMVDDLLDQQQVVIKNVEENYKKIEGISGATVLGDGTISFIIDINGLKRLNSFQNIGDDSNYVNGKG